MSLELENDSTKLEGTYNIKYLDEVIAACELAKAAKPIKSFVMKNLNELEGIKVGIYVISEVDGDCETTFEAFKDFKKKSERACAKLNRPSKILYVGSSTTGLMKRIKQHLGDGHKSTSALHLSHWAGERKIEIQIYEYHEERNVLQLKEDALSHELQPAFGKRGGNNK